MLVVTQRPAEDVRTRLLGAALEELSLSGVLNTSLRAIARRVGVTHQAIGHYFTSRSALFAQLAAEGFADMRRDIERGLAESIGTPADRVALVGAAYLRFAEERPALFDLMYGVGTPMTGDDPELAAARADIWMLFNEVVMQSREEGWGSQADADDLATAAWALLHGTVTLRAQGLRHGILGESPDEIARRAAALVQQH